ncbi:MAG TPA: glycosyltransferase [Candidatus Binatia bacterium]|nr:glycosyltransferase [Candidatus Binatia bacterium]
MRVAFLGAFDPGYPRVRVLQEGLVEHGVDARLYPLSARPMAREAKLIGAWLSGAALADAFVVPSFGHRDVPPISLLTHAAGAPLLFDPLVSRWDTQVRDLGRVRAGSVAAARLRASDAVAMRLADVVLCDTWEHGELFASEFGVPRSKLARVPVGADRAAFALGEARAATRARDGAPLHVVYVGGFLPLHGVEMVIGAAAFLEARRGAGFARFTLVGDGMTAHRADRDAAALGLRSLRRVPRVPYPEALAILADADVALGIFGTTEKAARVIPHKVYQALAAGVPVVTRRSPAVVELFPGSSPMALVPPGDAEALSAAIETLAEDPARREAMGAAGREAALRFATPERVGAALLEAIRRPRGGLR